MKLINRHALFQYVISSRFYKKGIRAYKNNQWKDALFYFQDSVKEQPHHAYSHFKLGLCYLKLREFEKAVHSIEKATSLLPAKSEWRVQLAQAKLQADSHDVSNNKILRAHAQENKNIIPRLTLREDSTFFCHKKKSILLVPSDYNERVMADILPFIEFYKSDFQVYIILKDINVDIQDFDDYILVKNGTSFGEFLKFTADYVIDAGSLNYGYRITNSNRWASVWHGIPYKKMFSDLDIKHLSSGIRYGLGYDVMISMSKFYTETFLKKSMGYFGEIAEIGCAKADYFFKPDKRGGLKTQVGYSEEQKIVLVHTLRCSLDLTPIIDVARSKGVVVLLYTQDARGLIVTDLTINRAIKESLTIADLIFISDLIISDSEDLLTVAVNNQLQVIDCRLDEGERDSGFKNINWRDVFSTLQITQRSLLKYKLGIQESKKVVLYAPTFRKAGPMKLPFDPDRLLSCCGEDYVFVTKLHYLNTLQNSSKNVIDCSNYSNISELMKISDVLISDYSSLLIDYSLLKKPIVLYQYDYESYKNNRGVYFDLNEYVEASQIVQTERDLYNIDWHSLSNDTRQLVNEFYPLEDGHSTERIVEYLAFDSETRKTKDIIFLVNELNQIGGVHGFLLNMARYYKKNYNSRIFVMAIKEFSETNKDVYILEDDSIDFRLSAQYLNGACSNILQNTDGIVISLQFSAHLHFQKYLDNAKTILMFHGDIKDVISREVYGPHLDWINNDVLLNYDKLLLLSRSNLDLLMPEVNSAVQDKLDYIPNSIALDSQEMINNMKSISNFAYIGRLDIDKNVPALITLAEKLKEMGKNITINVYGDGPLRADLEKTIIDNELSSYLQLHGYVSDKHDIFKENSGLILMSKTEGMPLVILEAYAYGKPVIIFDTFTAAKDVVVNNVTGYLIDPWDYTAFIEAMETSSNIKSIDVKNHFEKNSNENVFSRWNQLFKEIYN